jgi:hypothetical protein
MSDSELRTEIFRGVAYVTPPKDLSEELQRLIEQAKVGATANQLRFQVGEIYGRDPFPFWAPLLDRGRLVYRARKMDARPNNLSEITYPPANITKCGRVNREQKPLFYGTLGSFGPCLMECGGEPGDHFVIGKWELRRPLIFGELGFSKKLNLSRPNRLYPDDFIKDQKNPAHQCIKDWQCDVLTRPIKDAGDEWIYRLSTAIAELALEALLPVEAQKEHGQSYPAGVIYPSVASNTFGDNIAVLPSFIDNDFKFVAAIWVKVGKITAGVDLVSHYQTAGQLQVIDVGFCDEGGDLEWSPHPVKSPVFSRYPARSRGR